MKTQTERFMDKVVPEPNSGCWLWMGADAGGGYGMFQYNGKRITAHRAAYKLFVGEIADGMDACHKCDVRKCVNPDHLFAGTRSDNMLDCVSKGRNRHGTVSGVHHHRSCRKLSDDTVLEIMTFKGRRLSNRALKQRFGVCRQTCSKIWNGETWRHITIDATKGQP